MASVTYKAVDAAEGKSKAIEVPATVTLEDGSTAVVTAVEANAFAAAKSVKKIVLPKTVETVDAEAFKGCKKLQTVDLSATKVKTIEKNTFANCKALKTVKLPVTLTEIKAGAFKGIKSKTLTITLTSKKLTKKSVKNAFKGVKIKKVTIKIKVGSKKENKKVIAKYKKFFTKKNVGVKIVFK